MNREFERVLASLARKRAIVFIIALGQIQLKP
jgi:hypothetical protein